MTEMDLMDQVAIRWGVDYEQMSIQNRGNFKAVLRIVSNTFGTHSDLEKVRGFIRINVPATIDLKVVSA